MTAATKATPERPDQLEEALLDENGLKRLQGADGKLDPAKLRDFIKEYTKNAYEKDPGLGAQLKDAVKQGMQAFVSDAKDKGLAPMLPMGGDGASARGALDGVYKAMGLNREQRRQIAATGRGPGAALHGQYETFGHFLDAIAGKTPKDNNLPKILNDMSESVGADGGFTVPEEFRAELLRLELESAVVRPRARVIPMASASVRIPAILDASHASTVFGGVQASWTAELASLGTGTQPSFAQILLQARKLTGLTVASNELLADSAISLEALIMSLFGDALAYFEDDAFIAGTGAGQPLGVINSPSMVTVTKEVGQPAATINYANIVKMFSRALPQAMGRGVWYGHPDILPELARLSLSVGTGGSAVWISNIQGGPPATIFGRPVMFSEKAETLGTAGDLVFADFGFYLIGDRQALQVASSPHAHFPTDEMTWRFVQRVDGRPWLISALTPRNGSNTLSAFVSLATRS